MRVLSFCLSLRCSIYVSYKLGQNVSDVNHRLVLEKLFVESEVICFQETWLSRQDLGNLNSVNPSFHWRAH